MTYQQIPGTDLKLPRVIMGCMHLTELDKKGVRELAEAAMEQGCNYFDHADIYGGQGACERLFAEAMEMTPAKRETMILQSKAGIVQQPNHAYYDFSKQHILEAVDGSLKRLNTDYLDILLLHRPDALTEPEEVAAALDELSAKGKVKHFGVSNHNPMQMELLKRYVKQPLLFNQLQFSVAHTPMVDEGLTVNMKLDQSTDRTGGILDYCRLHDVTVQAWSPFQEGFFGGPFLGDVARYGELNGVIDQVAEKYGVTNTAVAVAWILRHPANIQVVTGTTKPWRFADCVSGCGVELTRREWYDIYVAAGNVIP